MIVVLLELLAGGVLREEQLGEILKIVDRVWQKRVEPIRCYFLQARGKTPAQNGVVSGIDHDLVLIVTEVLDRVALTEVTSKVGL